MKITATVITLNEEANIGGCLESLEFADEIVVVDSGSTDRTAEICRAHPKVHFHQLPWEGFGRQKNLAGSLALHDWILNVDADERVSPELRASVLGAELTSHHCFRMARENYFGRRWIRRCGWYPDYTTRLYDRRQAGFSARAVHESVVCQGSVGTLQGRLVHYSYQGIADYLRRMDRYSTLAAQELAKSRKSPSLAKLLYKPVFTFLKMYLLKLGLLEGYTGLLLSLLYAQYTFCKYAKARELMACDPDNLSRSDP